MPMPVKDLTGRTFGYLKVLRREGAAPNKVATWRCRCVCGAEVVRNSTSLRAKDRGPKKSCGCRRGEMLLDAWGTHGMSDSRPYKIWQGMKSRCRSPKDKDFKNYGGRGIDMPDAWYESFDCFWRDVRAGYQDDLTIDRPDNMKGYSKRNHRWVDCKTQSRNMRPNVVLQTPWGRMTLAEAAERMNIRYITLHARYHRYGWRGEKLFRRGRATFTTSLRAGRKKGS